MGTGSNESEQQTRITATSRSTSRPKMKPMYVSESPIVTLTWDSSATTCAAVSIHAKLVSELVLYITPDPEPPLAVVIRTTPGRVIAKRSAVDAVAVTVGTSIDDSGVGVAFLLESQGVVGSAVLILKVVSISSTTDRTVAEIFGEAIAVGIV